MSAYLDGSSEVSSGGLPCELGSGRVSLATKCITVVLPKGSFNAIGKEETLLYTHRSVSSLARLKCFRKDPDCGSCTERHSLTWGKGTATSDSLALPLAALRNLSCLRERSVTSLWPHWPQTCSAAQLFRPCSMQPTDAGCQWRHD